MTEQVGDAEAEAVRIRLGLRYDGQPFAGWARQPDQPTVQGALEGVLRDMLSRARVEAPISTVCAGRTDAGVHARGQVVHFDLPRSIWDVWRAARLLGQLNTFLPPAIRAMSAEEVPPEFDARFSAFSRLYRYRICDDPTRIDPMKRGFIVSRRRPLDLSLMNAAGTALLGEHDFAGFCRPREGASTVRTLLTLEWARDQDRNAVLAIEADAFCHSMVRAIVGALVAVGESRKDPDWLRGRLEADRRDASVLVMPPHGLVLEHVAYPETDQLGIQAARARRRRGRPTES